MKNKLRVKLDVTACPDGSKDQELVGTIMLEADSISDLYNVCARLEQKYTRNDCPKYHDIVITLTEIKNKKPVTATEIQKSKPPVSITYDRLHMHKIVHGRFASNSLSSYAKAK